MDELQVTLTADERTCLVELLQNVVKQKRVEEHRTRAPNYREHVLRQEELIQALLAKLEQPSA